ncbi:MAG: efflux RND transporter periplasmic adaptor subunit [Verrucomicrobia bacterium]|nr:efflux RND transporter periplasmic adaptor subunit [Verrucomicrobiota bacterium]
MNGSSSHLVAVLRKSAKWVVLVAIIAFAVYRVKFAPTPVLAHEVKAGPIVAEVMGTGTLEARVKTTISPRIQERLAAVLVDQNDAVKTGQLLARLDDGELKMQVEVATASLAAARASLDRVKTDEARASAVVRQARLDHQRSSELLTNRISSQSDFDKAVEQMNVAEADVKRSQAAIVEAERQMTTAEKNLAYQKERLSFTQIVSPYDGLITRRDRDPGGVVVPGSSILQIISTNEIWVSAWVDETAMARLAPGQPARVVFRSEPAKSYPGEVARLGREADRETREFLVDVRGKQLPKNWSVGQRAEVFIETGRKESTLALPLRFLIWRAGQPGVIARQNGRAQWRGVKLGLRGLETVEVTEGLSSGAIVCKPRDMKQPLNDGQRINIAEAPSSKPN